VQMVNKGDPGAHMNSIFFRYVSLEGFHVSTKRGLH